MIYSISKFRHYLLGRKFTFHVDHSTLLYLVNKQALTGRLARWMLLLQEFDIDIHHRPGVQHAVADYLSSLETGDAPAEDCGDFPDAALFTINDTEIETHSQDTWIRDMSHFLTTGLPP